MRLSEKQRKFSLAVADLVLWAYAQGYELTLGDAYRDPRVFGKVGERKGYGRSQSLHKQRLAIDLNLFIGGAYQRTTEAHRPLGRYWEEVLGPRHGLDLSWGGRFNDGTHYSCRHAGRR